MSLKKSTVVAKNDIGETRTKKKINKEHHNVSENKVETNCLSYQEKINLIGFMKTLCTT